MLDDLLTTPSTRLFAEYQPDVAAKEAAPEQMVYGDATRADVEVLARLVHEREGIALEQAVERVTRWLELDAESHCLIVARIDSHVVGYGRAGQVRVESAPVGWYLTGVIVNERFRRRGIGMQITRRRLEWIRARGGVEAFYFVNSRNFASIDLHRQLGFEEIQRPFAFPGCSFTGGVGVLFRVELAQK